MSASRTNYRERRWVEEEEDRTGKTKEQLEQEAKIAQEVETKRIEEEKKREEEERIRKVNRSYGFGVFLFLFVLYVVSYVVAHVLLLCCSVMSCHVILY